MWPLIRETTVQAIDVQIINWHIMESSTGLYFVTLVRQLFLVKFLAPLIYICMYVCMYVCMYRMAGKFGGEFNFALWRNEKIHQY